MRWLSGNSFFQPVTRAKPGWRPWVPVWLYTGAFVAVCLSACYGHPLEFDTSLLPADVRVSHVEDQSQNVWPENRIWYYLDRESYELYRDEVSAHAIYLRYSGTLTELMAELRASALMQQYADVSHGSDLAFVRRDGRVVLRLDGGDSPLPWDKSSFVIYARETRTPDADYLRRAHE